jgi:hypothetical protein
MTSTTSTLTPEQAREIVALSEDVDRLVKEAKPTIVAAAEAARRLHHAVSDVESPEDEFTPETHPLRDDTWGIAFVVDPATVDTDTGPGRQEGDGLLAYIRYVEEDVASLLERVRPMVQDDA